VNLLLDTSALLIHFYKEPGGDRVQDLLADESNEVLIASVSITELARRLVAMGTGWTKPGARACHTLPWPNGSCRSTRQLPCGRSSCPR